MSLEFRLDDLRGDEIRALLRQHLESALQHSPPGSVHALDVDGLRQAGVTFWSAWEGEELAGCCALRELDTTHGEIKSMRTVDSRQRRGVGALMLQHLLEEARRRGYSRLSLETGSMQAFAPARQLYARFGFAPCPPFTGYVEDPYSLFMTRELEPA